MTKQRFHVDVTRLAIVYQQFTVEAETPEEAQRLALEDARQAGDTWEIDDLFDDGEDHSRLAATTVVNASGETIECPEMTAAPEATT